jgi:hypothetical protein
MNFIVRCELDSLTLAALLDIAIGNLPDTYDKQKLIAELSPLLDDSFKMHWKHVQDEKETALSLREQMDEIIKERG